MAAGFVDYLRGILGWSSAPVSVPAETGPAPSWNDPTVIMLVPVMLLAGDEDSQGTGRQAIHYAIGLAVTTVIQQLGLTGISTSNIVLRKFPHKRRDDTLPLIVVSTHQPAVFESATTATDNIRYPVTVTTYAVSNQDLTLNHERQLEWCEVIRRAFHQKRLSDVESVSTCQVPRAEPMREMPFIAANVDCAQVTLNFISREKRI